MKSSVKLLLGSLLLLAFMMWGFYDEASFRFFWMKIYENRKLLLIVLGGIILVFGIGWLIKNRERPPKRQGPVFPMQSPGNGGADDKKTIRISNRKINWFQVLKSAVYGIIILAIIGISGAIYKAHESIPWWGWPAIVFVLGLIICAFTYRKAFDVTTQKEEGINEILMKTQRRDARIKDPIKDLWKKRIGKLFLLGCLLLVSGIVWILLELSIRGIKHPFTQVHWPAILIAAAIGCFWWMKKKPQSRFPKWTIGILIVALISSLTYMYYQKPVRIIGVEREGSDLVWQFKFDSLRLKSTQDQSQSQMAIAQRDALYQNLQFQFDSVVRESTQIKLSSNQNQVAYQQRQQEIALLQAKNDSLLRVDSAKNLALIKKDQEAKEQASRIGNLESQFGFAGKRADTLSKERDSLKIELAKEKQNSKALRQEIAQAEKRNSLTTASFLDWRALVASLIILGLVILLIFLVRREDKRGKKVWLFAIIGSLIVFSLGMGAHYLFGEKQTKDKDWKKEKEQLVKKHQVQQDELKDSIDALNQRLAEVPQNTTVTDTSGMAKLRQENDSLSSLLKNDSSAIKLQEAQETIKDLEKKIKQKQGADTAVVVKTDEPTKRKDKKFAKKKGQIQIKTIAKPSCCLVSSRANKEY